MNLEISKRLTMLMVGGCTCQTKTPELQYHDERCTYRLAAELSDLIQIEFAKPRELNKSEIREYLGLPSIAQAIEEDRRSTMESTAKLEQHILTLRRLRNSFLRVPIEQDAIHAAIEAIRFQIEAQKKSQAPT